MPATLLLRPDLEFECHVLHCAVIVDAPIAGIKTDPWLDYAVKEKVRQGNLFIEQMERQGWRYLGEGLNFTDGPKHFVDPRGMARRVDTPRRVGNQPTPNVIDTQDHDYYTQKLAPLAETEKWVYQLSGKFIKRQQTETAKEYLNLGH